MGPPAPRTAGADVSKLFFCRVGPPAAVAKVVFTDDFGGRTEQDGTKDNWYSKGLI
jgi:hypothetical protein